MPLPFFLALGALAAGTAGVASGVHGATKMKEANDTMKLAESCHRSNIKKFEEKSEETNKVMDTLGEMEMRILESFDSFSDIVEKIQNRPEFKGYDKDGVSLPKYNKEELKNVSLGAGIVLGGLGGAALGTAGGFAAAGATTSAVMALGTASTGTAISSLSGVAATNATLAALGGGAIGSSATAGGMALGSTVLGATTLGAGLLVGGIIFNVTGSKMSDKAEEAFNQMLQAEKKIDKICKYLGSLKNTANKYTNALTKVRQEYINNFDILSNTVDVLQKTDWNEFSEKEKTATQNTVMLVGLLYKMCQVNLVNKAEKEDDMNTINKKAVEESISDSDKILAECSAV